MARACAEALKTLLPLLRQLRDIKGVKEVQPGTFQARRDGWIQLQEEEGSLFADLKKPGGSGFDRFALGTASEQRRFIDEAKLRARHFDDD